MWFVSGDLVLFAGTKSLIGLMAVGRALVAQAKTQDDSRPRCARHEISGLA